MYACIIYIYIYIYMFVCVFADMLLSHTYVCALQRICTHTNKN